MKLTINELDKLFKITLSYLKQKKIQHIGFEGKDNYYPKFWRKDINFNNSECMKCPPYTIGSLADDIKDLKNVLIGKHEFFSLDLEKFGTILTTIGALLDENINLQPNKKKYAAKLSLSDLGALFKNILTFLKKETISEIFFEGTNDCYLKVSHKDINFYGPQFLKCPPYTIDSLTENIIALKKIVSEEIKMNGCYLQQLGAILTAFGEII